MPSERKVLAWVVVEKDAETIHASDIFWTKGMAEYVVAHTQEQFRVIPVEIHPLPPEDGT